MTTHTAFFYGTLMAPQVLNRVLHNPGPSPLRSTNPLHSSAQRLTTVPAVLRNFTRHCVRNALYPAIIATPGGTVRGTLVSGLTAGDVRLLDLFEGGSYVRVGVRVRVLSAEESEKRGEGKEEVEEWKGIEGEVEAETYVWIAGEEYLESKEWDFDAFRRERMSGWVDGDDEGEFEELEEAKARDEGEGKGKVVEETLESAV